MSILEIIILCLILYCLGLFFEKVGLLLASLLSLAGLLFVLPEKGLKTVTKAVFQFTNTTLAWPPAHKDAKDENYSFVIDLVSRLIYGILGAMVMIGEIVNVSYMVPYLFSSPDQIRTVPPINLPISSDLATAFILVGMPALFASLVLESGGFIPHKARLFKKLDGWKTITFTVLALFLFALSVLVILYSYHYRAVFLASSTDPELADIRNTILVFLALLIPFVCGASLWGIAVGFSALLFILGCILAFIGLALRTIPYMVAQVLHFLCSLLSRGRLTPYTVFEEPSHAIPSLPFFFKYKDEDLDTEDDPPAIDQPDPTKENKPMKVNREKTASLLLTGLDGSQIADHTFTMIKRIKANPSFLTSAIIDLARQDQAITMPPGIKDISPTDAEYLAARVGAKNDAVIYTRLFYNYVQKLVDEHEKKGGMPGPLTFFMQVQLVTCARRAIQTLKRDRMSHHTIITIHNISDELLTNKETKEGLAVLKELCETGDIDAAIITNSRTIEPTDSEEAKYEQAKLASIALSIVGLVRGYKHHPSNRTLISVIQELQAYSRILGMSFATEPVTEGQVSTSWRIFRWVLRNNPRANKGTVNDIFNQACKAIDNAFKEMASRATNAPVPLNLPVACLCFIPIPLNDYRFPILLGLIKQFIEESYPLAIPLVIRGDGVPSPSQQGLLRFVEAACVYPIQGNQLLIPPQIIDSEAQEVEVPLEVAPEEENNHYQNGASSEKKKRGRQKKVSPGSQEPEKNT